MSLFASFPSTQHKVNSPRHLRIAVAATFAKFVSLPLYNLWDLDNLSSFWVVIIREHHCELYWSSSFCWRNILHHVLFYFMSSWQYYCLISRLLMPFPKKKIYVQFKSLFSGKELRFFIRLQAHIPQPLLLTEKKYPIRFGIFSRVC